MTGGYLAKYDWRRRLRGSGSGHYTVALVDVGADLGG